MECPNCNKDWPYLSEQQVAVELKGHCEACEINCSFQDCIEWNREDWDRIRNVGMLRREMHIDTNFHQCLRRAGAGQ